MRYILLLLFCCFASVAAEYPDFPLTVSELGLTTEIREDLMFEQVTGSGGNLYFVYNGKNPVTVLDLQLTAGDEVKEGTFFLLLEPSSGKQKIRVYMAQDVTVLAIRPALGRYSTLKQGDVIAVFRAKSAERIPPKVLTPYQQAEKLLAQINGEEDDAKAEDLTKRLLLLLQVAKKESVPEDAAKAMVMEFYIHTEKGGEKKTDLLTQAAELGNGEACYLLGLYHKAASPDLSTEYFQKALAANFPGAGIEYGLACYRKDKNRAKDAFHADALRGIAKAQNLYGVALLREGQFAKGKEWIEKAAAQKYPPAVCNLGIFARNENTAEGLAESVRLFALAAESGYAPAKRNLAQAYWDGFGIKADTAKAKQLAAEAADAGDRAAYYLLGMMAITEKQPEKAFPFYLKAAELGYSPACLQTALMYRQGIGVKADGKRADYWLERREKTESPEEISESVKK